MANIAQCLSEIIGLSQTTCECFPDPPPGYNTSPSPYFVDDPKYGAPLSLLGKAGCGEGEIWDKLQRARIDGANAFLTQFLLALSHFTKRGRAGWSGNIGDKFNMPLSLTDQYAGLLIEPHQVKGGILTIDCIGLVMDCDGIFDVEIYDCSDTSEPVASVPITTIAGRKVDVVLDQPLRLPMTDKKGRCKKYLIVYDRQGCQPYNVEFHCGCGSSSIPGYYKFLNVGGVSSNDTGAMCVSTCNRSHTNGLCISIDFACNSLEWLCSSWDYNCDPFGRVLAQTIQFFAIHCLIQGLMTSTKLDPAVQCNSEMLGGLAVNAEKNIEQNIAWLAQNIPAGVSDCFECINPRGQRKAMIRV